MRLLGAVPKVINLAWPPIDGAAEYRFLLRDVAAGDIALGSGSLDEPAYELDYAELDPEKQYEWRWQWRRPGEERWRDGDPYLSLIRDIGADLTTPLAWEGTDLKDEAIYRVVIRDEALDQIVAKYALRGHSYDVDWRHLDASHPHRWKLQRFNGHDWDDLCRYRTLTNPTAAVAVDVPIMIKLAWPPIDGAAEYRFLLRDVAAGDIALGSGSLDKPAYELDYAGLDPEKQYEWHWQWRPRWRPPGEEEWRDGDPCLWWNLQRFNGDNWDDLRNYRTVTASAPTGAVTLDEETGKAHAMLAVPPCPVCGDSLREIAEDGYCPGCNAPARARSLPELLETVVGPAIAHGELADLPLLAFAAPRAERLMLAPYFHALKSVSLFGEYGSDHESGVDIRDLGRYANESFSGAFGILLFDYFPEFDEALSEVYRVLAPGGVFFTLVLSPRVRPDDSPPEVTKRIEPKKGYFDYIPEGGELFSVKVGQDWFLRAIARAGLRPQQVRLLDQATGDSLEWFVGFKPRDAAKGGSAVSVAAARPVSPSVARKETPDAAQTASPHRDAPLSRARTSFTEALAPARTVGGVEVTEEFQRTYVCVVDPAFGFEHATVKLTIPSVPLAARPASFAEHVVGTGTVLGVQVGGVVVSTDLGRNWQHIELEGAAGLDFVNCFTTTEGHRLLQVKSSSDDREPNDPGGAILRYDAEWNLVERTHGRCSHWHGTASVDQAGDTIMWAEYPNNAAKYEAGNEHLAIDSRVFRSRDGGSSWEVVFEQDGLDIRHFHTLVADRHVGGQWWLSSGDRPEESRVWVSRNNGDNWEEVTNPAPDVEMRPEARSSLLAVHRYTDIWIGEDELLWGADDWLTGDDALLWGADGRLEPATLAGDDGAPPLGARIFRSPRSFPLRPREVGWIGNPVRSITDLGEALLVTTEGKRGLRPQVCLVSKNGSDVVQQLFTIEVLRDTEGSGFTYSKASPAAEWGTFFSYRGSLDIAPLATRILKWEIDLY